MAKSSCNTFQKNILSWFDEHGRKQLPWQLDTNPYRVWVSEIMLQQTQVNTVIPYFQRFMQSFPDVVSLADAASDDVLHHWSGLGYYARARNLHQCAKIITQQYQGKFPNDIDTLMSLPGIGRSTAGAILSLGFHQAAVILDGNVKRVLARCFAVPGWPGTTTTLKKLWQIAEDFTPDTASPAYTQAMMDLGSMVCTRSKPNCQQCPVQSMCIAYQQQTIDQFPGKKPKKVLPVKQTIFLIFQNEQQHILLEQRPATGLWGGLWCFPQCENETMIDDIAQQHYQLKIKSSTVLDSFRHTFSHYHLDITPIVINTDPCHPYSVHENQQRQWINPDKLIKLGLAKPVTALIQKVAS